MKIAIVDDEAYWREKAEECIKEEMKNEIEITVYDNPISYLESKDEYDISLIDIEMDELDGFETIKKAREKNKDTIFMILQSEFKRRAERGVLFSKKIA